MDWSGLRLEFERYLILPWRWMRRHFSDCRDRRQKCKVCVQADGFNFHVPDELWQRIVPRRWQNRVVCLRCFDAFAKQMGIDYVPFLQDVCFAGDYRSFEVAIVPPKAE